MPHAILVCLLSVAAFGQSTVPNPVFEVASVRLHEQPGGGVGISTSGSRFTAISKTVAGLLMFAYDAKSYQVPDTTALRPFDDTFYDIAAKAEGDSTPSVDQFRLMLQALLADRFKLQVHHETREVPVYELVVAKNGPRLTAASIDADSAPHYAANGRNWDFTSAKASMDDLVIAIENSIIDRPVLNKTGLTGSYAVRLIYTPATPANRKSPDPDDISIFTAVEQLGLRLEAAKARVDMIVVDHVEKPSGN